MSRWKISQQALTSPKLFFEDTTSLDIHKSVLVLIYNQHEMR